MIGYNQEIHEKNVISCLYQVDLDNLNEAIVDFIEEITNSGHTFAGQLFYSINSDLRQKTNMIVELFISVEEDTSFLDDRFTFRTYFQLTDLLCIRAKGDSEYEFSKAIEELISEIIEQDLTIKTPTFYKVYVTEDDLTFTDIYIGVRG
ncbi:DUF5085 family protein [Streptococcus loxodontisalivarius]|uniref:DUF5085 family protein n=1 Tax=Streptococcus loxodontisalivarius TaxID=1349415 RepID=A0ABS2PTD4_9STRE|nr:DUF5085 family protein [Streptococcus loxodontisalivarius]MBM7642769.1 hypothetical protein [Streptococcus loxodontisalivarius]